MLINNNNNNNNCLNYLRHFETLRIPPLRRTLRACDHVTRARYFKVLWRVRFVDAYKFFSFCKSFCSFLFTLVVCHFPVYLLGLNLEFEPTIQGELFLNMVPRPGKRMFAV